MQSVPICTHIIKKKCLCSWNAGDWSDQNDNWNKVDDETKRKIGLRYKADGEFWMDYFKDFVHEFEEVSICTMGPDFDHDGQVDNANVSIKIQFHKKNSRIHIQFHEFFLLLSVQWPFTEPGLPMLMLEDVEIILNYLQPILKLN